MPLLIPVLALTSIAGIGYIFGTKDEPSTPASIPSAQTMSQKDKVFDGTTIIGYALAAGLIYYFGRKLLK